MYRFRSVDNLLGKYQELENQEIYFAPPQDLNDPMEGYRDIFWDGDEIVWKNLLIHYLRCLEHIFSLTILVGEETKITINDIPILYRFKNPLSPIKEENIKQISDVFFSYEYIKNLPKSLEKRNSTIRRNELLSHLKLIHPIALDSVSKVFLEKGYILKPYLQISIDEYINGIQKSGNLAEIINNLEIENPTKKDIINILFEQFNFVSSEVDLINKLNSVEDELVSNKFFILTEFSESFIIALESMVFPDWYSASFLSDNSNSAIWGHYGNNHEGICLKFKVNLEEEKPLLNLETEYGYNSKPVIGMRPHYFRKVNYHNKYTQINFFKSIGTMSKIELKKIWYSDSNGNLSKFGKHLNGEDAEWRDKYWENFYESISVKLKEWDYEKEYRLVINNTFKDYSDKKDRKLKYDFNDLDGIIFGIKTKTSDKIRILKIITEKCKKNNRKEFSFYQAYYSKESGKIETQKLKNISVFE